jgi:hypothetical protein
MAIARAASQPLNSGRSKLGAFPENVKNRHNGGRDAPPLTRTEYLRERRARESLLRRRQHLAKIVWRLGARAFFEFITELDRHYDIPDLDRRLERYADIDPRVLAALDGHKFAENPTRLVR